jgi:hypothetical protein
MVALDMNYVQLLTVQRTTYDRRGQGFHDNLTSDQTTQIAYALARRAGF